MNTRLIAAWLIVWIIIGGMVVFFYPEPNGQSDSVQNLSYSEFMDQVDRGNIAMVDIHDNGEINGDLNQPVKNSTKFSSKTLNADMSYVESLRREIRSKNTNTAVNLIKTGDSFWSSFSGMLPFIFLIVIWIWFMRRNQGQQMNMANNFLKPKTRLSQDRDKKTFQDVAGAEEAKEDLREIVEFLKNPQKFQKLGARIPKGVLLVGPPGTGKTLLAKAVAGEANVPFFSIASSEFVEMFVGVGAFRVRDLFKDAKQNAPCIIFIDEIDGLGKRGGSSFTTGATTEHEQTLNQVLTEMDGFEGTQGIIVIAATNRPDKLDSALLRPGRFDRKINVDLPDIKGREEIIKIHIRKIKLDQGVNLKVIARLTPGFSGADLANLVNEAALRAGKNGSETVILADFEKAKDKILLGDENRSLSSVMDEKEKEIIAYHEAGHTILACLLPESDPIHKVSIIPRGRALGITSQLPEKDRYNYSNRYLLTRLTILFGGRAAEELQFDSVTTGAQNDIEVATELARKMVCDFGMSSLGLVKYSSGQEDVFHGQFSETTKKDIDDAIRRLIKEAHEKASDLLKNNKNKLDKLSRVLMEKETLDGEEVINILERA